MKNYIFRSFFAKIFLIASAIFFAPSQAWATWSGNQCHLKGDSYYVNIPWSYTVTGPNFSNWLNSAASNTQPIEVAQVSLSTGSNPYSVMCAVNNGTFTRRDVSWDLPTNYGGYYLVPGFTDIKFKVKLQYIDNAMTYFPGSQGTPNPTKEVIMPAGAMPTSNFGACTAYMISTASSSYICAFSGNAASNTSFSSAYLQKTWTYTLLAYKTGSSPDVTEFPQAAYTLPVIKLNGAFTDTNGAGAPFNSTPSLYCIGCTGTGTPPMITKPAGCDIVSAINQDIPLNPPNVNWNNFSVVLNASPALRANPEWTPFLVQFSCKRTPTTARFYAKDATSGANTAEAAGKLLNSFGGNVGVQVFYKNEKNATCTGTTTPTSGVAVPLNNFSTVSIPGGTSTATPIQYFCARYYTTAASSDALTLGAVASTMSYTFQYE